jgi:hypothetical protein
MLISSGKIPLEKSSLKREERKAILFSDAGSLS